MSDVLTYESLGDVHWVIATHSVIKNGAWVDSGHTACAGMPIEGGKIQGTAAVTCVDCIARLFNRQGVIDAMNDEDQHRNRSR